MRLGSLAVARASHRAAADRPRCPDGSGANAALDVAARCEAAAPEQVAASARSIAPCRALQ
ncbi:hypothetical protein WS70_10085 [Burkholderia mayonis]|uniref:Uncharacterized protein n=1 Tax=Burkholderia mayonis TaxID=1385591 RepID=A0A1B4FEK7_9BURK|nr:hypothetical protein WS70_10085 [Burkholderia mayonis]KVE34412.1 hypothetical protein WS69_17715 [Burkholderia sp. BDU5]KVE44075.1 hypothetical protein WS70_07935 [Burkholderia mayonis]